jgi:squalene-hopene/tetraprenyl-beta-curcumene cyclase
MSVFCGSIRKRRGPAERLTASLKKLEALMVWCIRLSFMIGALFAVTALPAQDNVLPQTGDDVLLKQTASKGVKFLLQSQAEDGSFSKQISPAVTALCVHSLLEHGVPVSDQHVQKGLAFILSMVRDDGGIYAPNSNLRNYETSVSVVCLQAANQQGKYDQVIERAVNFLKGIQWDDGEGHTVDSEFYGGQGYGSHRRPDMSNTSFFMDALQAAGEDPDSTAMQNAMKFMQKCQNLPGKYNAMEFAQKTTKQDRGGFIYSPVGGGESKAGESDTGGLRSYASMTYAGLKSLLYAGVDKKDIRVQAAMDWIRRNYDLTTNPGMGKQGLYYYYHVFAKTLDAQGEPWLMTAESVKRDWKKDLIQQLATLQNKDGSWVNQADRWYEGDPNLVTAYALLALSYCESK